LQRTNHSHFILCKRTKLNAEITDPIDGMEAAICIARIAFGL